MHKPELEQSVHSMYIYILIQHLQKNQEKLKLNMQIIDKDEKHRFPFRSVLIYCLQRPEIMHFIF